MPATLRPARASGNTATPPAAPSPTTATSTGLRLMAVTASIRGTPQRFQRILDLLIVAGCGQARAGIGDQVPSAKLRVAAVVRIRQHAFERQPADAFEEWAGVGFDGGHNQIL